MNEDRKNNNRNNLTEILQGGRQTLNRPLSPISRLIRVILSDLNVRPHQFNTLLKNYLNDPMNGFDTPEAKSSENGNIKKEFSRDNSTFKTLVKLTKVLNPDEVEFSVRYKWHNGKDTTHNVQMHIPSFTDIDVLNMLPLTVTEEEKPRVSLEEIYKAIDMLNEK